MVYHLKITYLNSENPKRTDIEPIFFFNRMFNEAEIKYWPTELEMADLVWVIRKIRHMIENAKQPIVIFTDFTLNISIAKQTILVNNNNGKFNFRLVRAFIYFSQFPLNVKYRPGKNHVIPGAFSRLSSGNGPGTLSRNNDFLNLNTYYCGILNPSLWFSCPTIFENKFSSVMFRKIYRINW